MENYNRTKLIIVYFTIMSQLFFLQFFFMRSLIFVCWVGRVYFERNKKLTEYAVDVYCISQAELSQYIF